MAKKSKDKIILISHTDGGDDHRAYQEIMESELHEWRDYSDLRIHEVDEGKSVKIKYQVIIEELS